MTVSRAVNGTVSAAYLVQVLGPTPVPGNVGMLDDLPAHKLVGLAELVEVQGTRLLCPPPYSPNFNSVKLAFNKLRTWLRTAQARPREALGSIIQAAIKWISKQDAKMVRQLWPTSTPTCYLL